MNHHDRARILVVDDEPDLRTLCELTLLREGYRVETAADLAQARTLLAEQRFDVVITDMRLPDGLGMQLLHELRKERRPERCVVMTAYGSAENAVEALRAGAFDYLTKPVDIKQFRSVVASAAFETSGASTPTATAPTPANAHEPLDQNEALARIVGGSASMRELKHGIIKVARSMAPVLVRGESGTGKELVARALHASSQRARGPLVAVNCGAIPEALLEAEFFGARKGSYTGATQDRAGYFQAARGGTLFLDEIGELPPSMQPKLLRAIQERTVRALGSTQEEAVDVRIVSATHRDLAEDVRAGRFRQDLYYRLNVIELAIAPLRERLEDLPALCDALLTRVAGEAGVPVPKLSDAMLERLAQYPLRGNVRELENLLHRALAMSDAGTLQIPPCDAPRAAAPSPSPIAAPPARSAPVTPTAPDAASGESVPPQGLRAWLAAREREILLRALQQNDENRSAAAASLGISERQLRYRLARLRIAPDKQPDADRA